MEGTVVAATVRAKSAGACDTAVTAAVLTKPYSEDSRCWGAEGVVSIGNKGLEVAISLLNLGS